MKAEVLVLGAEGFLGRHIMQAAKRSVPIGRVRAGPRWRDHSARTEFSEALERTLDAAGPTVIVNAIGGTVGDVSALNLGPLEVVLDIWGRRGEVDGLVQFGSAAEYGSLPGLMAETDPCAPNTRYGEVKLCATQQALSMKERAIVLRPFSVVGAGIPSHTLIGRVREAIERGMEEVETGDLGAVRDFVAAFDVAEAAVRCAHAIDRRQSAAGQIINLGRGEGVVVRDMVDLMLELSPRPLRIRERTGVNTTPHAVAETTKATDILGWTSRIGPSEMVAAVIGNSNASAEV